METVTDGDKLNVNFVVAFIKDVLVNLVGFVKTKAVFVDIITRSEAICDYFDIIFMDTTDETKAVIKAFISCITLRFKTYVVIYGKPFDVVINSAISISITIISVINQRVRAIGGIIVSVISIIKRVIVIVSSSVIIAALIISNTISFVIAVISSNVSRIKMNIFFISNVVKHVGGSVKRTNNLNF